MQQSGEAREPEQPAQARSSDLPAAAVEGDGRGPNGPDSRAFLVVGVLLIVVVLAVIGWLSRGGDDGLDAVRREQERFPTLSSVAPPTVAPTTVPGTPAAPTPSAAPTPGPTPAPTPPPTAAPTPASTTAPAATAAPATTGLPPPTSAPAEPPYVATLVPSLAAFPEHLTTPESIQAVVDAMLASGRHDIAVADRSTTICAAVPMDRPLALRGRWERDGRRIAVTELERRDAPGFGECLDDDGEVLEPGAYQYVVIDGDGRESAAGGIVLGATRVDQPFVNDGETTICAVRIAPSTTDYFEIYLFEAAPITPGTTMELPVAGVEQDVQTVACDGGVTGGEVVASFSFQPDPAVVQSLDP